MANEAPEKMLARIRALLNKAEDKVATAEESRAYTAKATELMARYGIERAMLAVADPTTDVTGDRVVIITGQYTIEKQEMLAGIAEAMGCKAILRSRWRGNRRERDVHLFGYGSDLERVEMLYTSLLVQATNGLASTPVPYYEKAVTFRKSWLNGFRRTIVSRLMRAAERVKAQVEQERQDAGGTGPSMALVLADRSSVVQALASAAYPKLGKPRKIEVSGVGYDLGREAGHRADIGETRIDAGASGRRKAIG